ncbi:MAG TPA: hypothetical protein DGT23_20350 [Micromonosporaceae bacterium]|nr:hypothetical protein [Micromonosporaceae bacterium]
MLRLQAVAVLVAAFVAVAPNAAAAGVSTSREGIEPKTLATICEQFQGEFHEDPKSRYPYGCELSDGGINCLETTECSYLRLGNLPPLEESCKRAGGKYLKDILVFICWIQVYEVQVTCDQNMDNCGAGSIPNEQPMPNRPFRTPA